MSRPPKDCNQLTVSPAYPCDPPPVATVPLPGVLPLMLMGVAVLAFVRRNKNGQAR
jgi:hypothetical protein